MVGICLPGNLPLQYRRTAPGQVHRPQQRNRRAPGAGRVAWGDLPAVPGGSRADRQHRRAVRAALHRARRGGHPPPARGIRRPCFGEHPVVPAGPGDRAGRQHHCRDLSGVPCQPGCTGPAVEGAVMQIAPILAALKKHRMATFLIATEIALACAVLCNALYLVTERVRLSHVKSGVDEDRLVAITLDGVTDDQAADLAPRLRQRLAQLPGVESVSVANATPFGPQAGEMGFRIDPNDPVFHLQGHFYLGDANFAKTLGLRLVSGRWFTLDDYAHADGCLPKTSVVLVDADYAAKLWPGQDPLGKLVLSGNQTMHVVGLLARLVRPNPSPFATTNAFLMPTLPGTGLASVYLLRTVPGHAEEVFRRATAAISRDERGVIINAQASGPLATLRDAYFANTRSMAMMMVGVIAALLLVSALGIVGLASFWVQQRR